MNKTDRTGLGKRQVFDSITGLRGLACIFILCFHYYCIFIDDPGLGPAALPLYPFSEFFFIYSKNAVEFFFMISGFLIAFHYRTRIATMSPWTYMKKHYLKLLIPSVIVTTWSLVNVYLTLANVPGSEEYIPKITPLRVILSYLMVNTGWVNSFGQTDLPIGSTMWFVDILLLCYILYYLIRKIAKNDTVYMCLCVIMALVGWICLQHPPRLPFLWAIDGRGYAPFFIGVLICEFQVAADEKVRKGVSAAWLTAIAGFFIVRQFIGFGKIFGDIGSAPYVRYFEFLAAPGLLLAAVNLEPAKKVLGCKPLIWLGMLSIPIYYVHNSVFEDIRILNSISGSRINFSMWYIMIPVILCAVTFALLWQFVARKVFKVRYPSEKQAK